MSPFKILLVGCVILLSILANAVFGWDSYPDKDTRGNLLQSCIAPTTIPDNDINWLWDFIGVPFNLLWGNKACFVSMAKIFLNDPTYYQLQNLDLTVTYGSPLNFSANTPHGRESLMQDCEPLSPTVSICVTNTTASSPDLNTDVIGFCEEWIVYQDETTHSIMVVRCNQPLNSVIKEWADWCVFSANSSIPHTVKQATSKIAAGLGLDVPPFI